MVIMSVHGVLSIICDNINTTQVRLVNTVNYGMPFVCNSPSFGFNVEIIHQPYVIIGGGMGNPRDP